MTLSRNVRYLFLAIADYSDSLQASVGARAFDRATPLLHEAISPDHLLRVRYEDLTAAPEQTLRTICAFLGVPFDAGALNFRDGQRHVLNGNEMRHSSATEIRTDERWRQELTRAQLAYFERHGGAELNARLGYS